MFSKVVFLRGCRYISSSFCLEYNPKALRTTTSEDALLLWQKKLGTHVVVVFWVVIIRGTSFWPPTPTPRGLTKPPACPVTSSMAVPGLHWQWGGQGQKASPDYLRSLLPYSTLFIQFCELDVSLMSALRLSLCRMQWIQNPWQPVTCLIGQRNVNTEPG